MLKSEWCGRRKAQMTLIGVVIIFLSLVLLGALMPTIKEQITKIQDETDPTTDTLLGLIPLVFVVAIIIGIVFYASPHREPY